MLRLLETHNEVIRQAVAEQHGHVIKSTGDGFLVEFSSVVHAVQCAQQILTEIYGWFIEGFDTKDLQEAKALLEELN
jgi:hypothetical protein